MPNWYLLFVHIYASYGMLNHGLLALLAIIA
jgi:hypothetical protein